MSETERVVFGYEHQPGRGVRVIASGTVQEELLEALASYIERQRRRNERDAENAEWDNLP